jgi:dipeptidyl aminopeptidase/acylaminoacyl peptidase
MGKWISIVIVIVIVVLISLMVVMFMLQKKPVDMNETMPEFENITVEQQEEPLHPIAIEEMRKYEPHSSPIVIEETLADGSNFKRYIASYTSDGLKIYGLFTVPKSDVPKGGFPAIVFLHGYLSPPTYKTLERYVAYQNGFAAAGYVTFKPDLRGHGKSEGKSVSSNFSPDYIYDALNLTATLQNDDRVNKDKIGMWGHSMGGGITLRSMVVSKQIKAGVIWAGVVGNWEDLLERYRRRTPWMSTTASSETRSKITEFTEKYASPSANPDFWRTIDTYTYLADISGPVQLHHGTADSDVPMEFSQHLKSALEQAGKSAEYFEYPGGDHNLGGAAFSPAMKRSVEFFDRYLKED